MNAVSVSVCVCPARDLRPEFYLVIGSRFLCQAQPLDLKTIVEPLPKVYIRPRSQPTLRPTQWNPMKSPDAGGWSRPASVEILQDSESIYCCHVKIHTISLQYTDFAIRYLSSSGIGCIFFPFEDITQSVAQHKQILHFTLRAALQPEDVVLLGCLFDFTLLSSHPVSCCLGVNTFTSFHICHLFKYQSVIIHWKSRFCITPNLHQNLCNFDVTLGFFRTPESNLRS